MAGREGGKWRAESGVGGRCSRLLTLPLAANNSMDAYVERRGPDKIPR